MAGYGGGPKMAYKGNSPSTRFKGQKPYGSDGKPNYKGGPKADLYKGFRKDDVRGKRKSRDDVGELKQFERRSGGAPQEALYQMPNDHYTKAKVDDSHRVPPPKKPAQVYGKPVKGVSFSYGNKSASPKAAAESFKKTFKAPKPKPIKSISDLKGRVKKMGY